MKKVSILSPCYNVAKYLPKYLDSIIAQNYSPIELILVNDGSTDNTAEVIDGYRERLTENNIELKYIFKENGGQASAVALGIKEVTGEYLIWPDSDDFLLPDSIIKRVEYLNEHPNCGIVRSNGYVYNENELTRSIAPISKLNRTTYIEDFVSFSVPWCPGCYMVRMSSFDKANPERKIPISSAGQNIQMLLPMVFYYPCHYLDEYLFGYVIHSNSHSHSINTYEKSNAHLKKLKSCVEDTLDVINDDTSKYLDLNRKFFRSSFYRNAWNFGEKAEMQKFESELRENNEFNIEHLIMKRFKKTSFSNLAVRLIIKIKRGKKL